MKLNRIETFLEQPQADRFSPSTLEERGLVVGQNVAERFAGDFVIGVATPAATRLGRKLTPT